MRGGRHQEEPVPVLQVQQVSLCQHEEGGCAARESAQDPHQETLLHAEVLSLPLTFPPSPAQPPVLLLKFPAPHQVLPPHNISLPSLAEISILFMLLGSLGSAILVQKGEDALRVQIRFFFPTWNLTIF